MVLVHELRICHPYSVLEFERGLHYGNMKTAEQMYKAGGQGSALLSSATYYDDVYGEGTVNISQTRAGDKLPSWAQHLINPDQLVMNDETWFLYPLVRTVITCPALARLKIECMTLSVDDNGESENALRLTPQQLASRTVEHIDLGATKVDAADYREDRDPALVKSKLTGKGPLTPGWQEKESKMMCTYKVIIAECSYFGVASRVEPLLVSNIRRLTLLAHRTIFTTIDEWLPLTLSQVLDARDESKRAMGAKVLEVRLDKAEEPREEEGVAGKSIPALEDATEEEEEEDEFLDAEMELALEHKEARLQQLTGAEAIPTPLPSTCPFCQSAPQFSGQENSSTAPSAPTAFCLNCGEFYCSPCFDRVHVTVRMQQHKTHSVQATSATATFSATTAQPKSQPQAPKAPSFRSLSISGGVTVLIPPKPAPKKIFDPQSAAELFSPVTAGVKEMVAPVTDFVTGVLTWDQVKDPPLNVFTVDRKLPTAGSRRFWDSSEGGGDASGAPWLRVLRGSCDEIEGCDFVEIPAELAAEHPADVAGAMVSIMVALYRSANPTAPAEPSSFPLGSWMPFVDRMTQLFPSVVDPAKGADVSKGAVSDVSKGAGSDVSEESPYGTGNELDGWYRSLSKVIVLPSASSTASVEAQRLQAAVLFRSLAEELLAVDPIQIRKKQNEAVAFWINVHNALMMHAYLVFGIPKNTRSLSVLLEKASYVVGDVRFSAAAIWQNVLRPASASSCEVPALNVAALSSGPLGPRVKVPNPLVSEAAVTALEPCAIFALSIGTYSSPLVRPIRAEGLKSQLEDAARNYLEASIRLGRVKLHVPTLFYANRHGFGRTREEQLQVLLPLLPPSVAQEVFTKLDGLTQDVGDMISGWNDIRKDVLSGKTPTRALKVKIFDALPDDNTFRYLFPTVNQ